MGAGGVSSLLLPASPGETLPRVQSYSLEAAWVVGLGHGVWLQSEPNESALLIPQVSSIVRL